MKKLIVIGIVMTMVMGLASMASAVIDDYWLVQARALNGTVTAGIDTFGTKTGYVNGDSGVLAEDTEFANPQNGAGELVAIDLGVKGYSAPRWQKDQRAPMAAGGIQLWHLNAYIVGSASGTVRTDFWVPSAAKVDSAPSDLIVALFAGSVDKASLAVTGGVLKAGGVAPVFVFAQGLTGTSAATNYSNTWNFTSASPAQLTLVGYAPQVIPEPGSIVALMSGLVGLVGYGIRRRK